MSDDYAASFWIFENPFVVKIDAGENEMSNMEEALLESIPTSTDFLIFKTGFGKYRAEEKYWKNNPGLMPELAAKLRER